MVIKLLDDLIHIFCLIYAVTDVGDMDEAARLLDVWLVFMKTCSRTLYLSNHLFMLVVVNRYDCESYPPVAEESLRSDEKRSVFQKIKDLLKPKDVLPTKTTFIVATYSMITFGKTVYIARSLK